MSPETLITYVSGAVLGMMVGACFAWALGYRRGRQTMLSDLTRKTERVR